jgi:hypothetical protein
MVSLAAAAFDRRPDRSGIFGVPLPVYEANPQKNNGKIVGLDRAAPCA